jgi:hypothetical protein
VRPRTAGIKYQLQDVPRRGGCLSAVKRIRISDALTPADHAGLVLNVHEDQHARRHAAEARLERPNQGQPDLGQAHGGDAHARMVPSPRLDFRYLAIEGPPGLGKTALAGRLAAKTDAAVVLDESSNPFLAEFYAGRSGAAFQTQLFFTLARHRQLQRMRQGDLFAQTTICDYVFERDRIYAYTNLDDNELYIYQRLFDLVSRDVPVPDLVMYLQAPIGSAEATHARARQARRD